MTSTAERRFTDAYGVEVFSRWWMVDAPRGAVIISHGASEHSARYARFAAALNAVGLAAVAVDHRGHGYTGKGGGAVMGAGDGQAVVDDLHELRAALHAEVGSTVPVVLFGHSLGSLIGVAYLVQNSVGLAGAVLCGFPSDINEAAVMSDTLHSLGDAGMRDVPAGDLMAANNAPFEPVRTPADWLSRDPDEVDKYVADPLCGDANPLTFGYLIDLVDVVVPATRRLGDIECPVMVIAGDHDPAAGMGAYATSLAAALDAADVSTTLRLYEGARHELLNETNRDEVTADIIGWIDGVVG
jgi:alpha-beta hydrolase superfamily lysophospholipase